MLPSERPEWLRETTAGIMGGHKYVIFLEGHKYAIIKRPGYTGYVSRIDPLKYYPTTYQLVEKGKGFWGGKWSEVHQGRMNKEIRAKLEKILSDKEKHQ